MKLLVVLAVLGAAAAAEDQKAEEALVYSSYAGSPYPLAYTAGYPYGYAAPSVYSSVYNPVAYSGLYRGVYSGYAAPVVHSLKKRDTAAAEAEDQKAEEALVYSSYAAHPYPLAYTAGLPYSYAAPSVYSSAHSPLAYSGLYSGLYHGYAAPVVHSLKKRDTEAAEADQEGDDATIVSAYAAHPLTYAGYPYQAPVAYSRLYNTPASTAPLPVTYAGLPYTYPYLG